MVMCLSSMCVAFGLVHKKKKKRHILTSVKFNLRAAMGNACFVISVLGKQEDLEFET